MDELQTAIISAFVGGIVAAGGAVVNNYLNSRSKIDESLRDKRIEVYKNLWKKMKLLPKWPRSHNVTYENLVNFSEELRDWYFAEGGIYLSESARKAYNDLQETLTSVTSGKSGSISDDPDDKDNEYDKIVAKCSALRTELTRDLLSRRRGFLFS